MQDLEELRLRAAVTRERLRDAQAAHNAALAEYMAAVRGAEPDARKKPPAWHAGKRWLAFDDADLLRRWADAPDVRAIATAMGRTVGAIVSRLARHGVMVETAPGSEDATC